MINAGCGDKDSSFLQNETFHDNVSVSASREYSGIHQKNCVQVSFKVNKLCNLRNFHLYIPLFHNRNEFLNAEHIEWRNC